MSEGFYKIATLAKLTGVSAVAIRNWERRYHLLHPHRTEGGHRLYTDADRATLRRVRKLLEEGRSIGEIASLVRGPFADSEPMPSSVAAPIKSGARRTSAKGAKSRDDLDGALARGVLEALPQGILVTDARGRTEWINEACTELCGYTLAQLRGKTPGSVLQGPGTDQRVVRRIGAALAAREPCSERLLNYDARNRSYLAALDIAPLWTGEHLRGFVASVRDLTREGEQRAR